MKDLVLEFRNISLTGGEFVFGTNSRLTGCCRILKKLRDWFFYFICPRLIPRGSLWEKSGLFILNSIGYGGMNSPELQLGDYMIP